jgi:hypothetical protein
MQLPDLPQTELAIVELTNAFRRDEKLAPVKPNAALSKAAKAFAAYLASTGRFGHTVDGRQPADRTQAAGYVHCIVAENLAMNQDSRGFATRALAEQAVTGWKNSPPHRDAMLNPHVTEIGVGIVQGPERAPKFLSVQLFGRPDSFKYTFVIENHSGSPIQYAFRGETVDVPKNMAIKQSACTAESLAFMTIRGVFPVADGSLYRVTQPAGSALQVEVVSKPASSGAINPSAVRSGKSP